jgi:3-hydroxybutyryl-CoA dehydrogenase
MAWGTSRVKAQPGQGHQEVVAVTQSEETRQHVAVVGAGTMGTGIARLALQAGMPVHLFDVSAEAAEEARLALAAVGHLDVQVARDVTAVAGCSVIIDATPERPGKSQVLATIAKHASSDALLGTLTLATPVAALTDGDDLRSRLIGFHFMNPPHRLRFCELVLTSTVAPALADRARALLARLGISVVEVKDSSGFVLNRALMPFLFSAVRVLEEGIATPEDIDRSFVEGCAHPMGPLRILDLIGLDVAIRIGEYLAATTGGAICRPPDLLYTLAAQGKLGRAAGAGLHRYGA